VRVVVSSGLRAERRRLRPFHIFYSAVLRLRPALLGEPP